MPAIGPPAATIGIQFQNIGVGTRRLGGMLDECTEQPGEILLGGVIQMLLVTEGEHLVLQQGGTNGRETGGGDPAGQLHATDLSTDGAGDRVNAQALGDTVGRDSGGHDSILVIRIRILDGRGGWRFDQIEPPPLHISQPLQSRSGGSSSGRDI